MARRVSEKATGPRDGAEPLALDGQGSPKLRARRAQDIRPEQIATFFATLEETCNVARAARAAGFARDWAYRKRRSDAEFRNGWAAAVREGYARLEMVLLERAMKGTPKLVRTAKGSDRVMREYSTALAVALLKRHSELADSASEPADGSEIDELRTRILGKLERLRRRNLADKREEGSEGAEGGPEASGAAGAAGVVDRTDEAGRSCE